MSDGADLINLIGDNVRQMMGAEHLSLIQVVKVAANNLYTAGFNEGLKEAAEIELHSQGEQQVSPASAFLPDFELPADFKSGNCR
jgi:hypothetical protein